MDMRNIPMVRVTWKDAQDSDGSWTSLEDIIAHEPATCQEVGWLVHQDDTKIIVMRSRICTGDELEEGGAHIAIPTDWVTEVEKLKVEVEDEENNIFSANSYQSVHAS